MKGKLKIKNKMGVGVGVKIKVSELKVKSSTKSSTERNVKDQNTSEKSDSLLPSHITQRLKKI